MVMDILEHETAETAVGTLATRADLDLFTINDGAQQVLNRSFLIKRMEVNFVFLPPVNTDDATTPGSFAGYLALQDESSGTADDTVAEAFNAPIDADHKHNTIIWAKTFFAFSGYIDDTDNVTLRPTAAVMNTSKSFPKGFPLDKLKTYQWKVFNPSGSNWATGALVNLRVKYFGVYL